MKHFSAQTISILLVFIMLAGFVPFQQNGYADNEINNFEELKACAGSVEDTEGVITLKFDPGNYVFNSTVELEDGKDYMIAASGKDVCFSHGLFSGEMIFVPESSSLMIYGFESDDVSPFLFRNTYSIADLSQPIAEEEPTGEEATEDELDSDLSEGEANGADNGSYDVITETEGEVDSGMSEGEEVLTEVFVKSFSTLALVEDPLSLRAIVAQGSLSLNNVSFVDFTASAGLSGTAVSLESASPAEPDSKFCSVSFENHRDSEDYAFSIAEGRTVYLENISVEGCKLKNNGGTVIVSSEEISSYIDGDYEVKEETESMEETPEEEIQEEEEEIVEEDSEEEEEIVEEIPEEKKNVLMSAMNFLTPEKEQSTDKTETPSNMDPDESDGVKEKVENTVTSDSNSHDQSSQNVEQTIQQVQQEQTVQPQTAQQQTSQSYIDNAPKESIVVSANWTDNNNSARRRPGKTQVSLYLNNSLYMNATLSAENNWTYTFSNLTPGYSYRVEQSAVADYATSYRISGNTVYVSNQYTGAQPGSSTAQQNIQQGYNNPQNAYNNLQTQYPNNNAVQSTSAPTVRATPAPAATAAPVATQVPAFTPAPTRSPAAVPTSEPLDSANRESSHAWIWIVLLVVSAGAIAAVLFSMNRAKKQREAQEAARERARKRAAEAEMRRAQADISEGVRRTQNAERTSQRPRPSIESRQTQGMDPRQAQSMERRRAQSRESYSGSQNRNYDRSAYRNDGQRREAPRESSRDTEYKPRH